MKSTILFVGTSLILVVAMVAIANLSAVQADPPHEWCYRGTGGINVCFDNRGECRKDIPSGVTATCVKIPVP